MSNLPDVPQSPRSRRSRARDRREQRARSLQRLHTFDRFWEDMCAGNRAAVMHAMSNPLNAPRVEQGSSALVPIEVADEPDEADISQLLHDTEEQPLSADEVAEMLYADEPFWHDDSKEPLDQLQMSVLPSFELKQETKENCAICWEPLKKGQTLRALPCAHKYHVKCIDQWIGSHKSTCPECRRDIRPSLDDLV